MKILITGIAGFAGSTLASGILKHQSGIEITGIDNFSRPGSEYNRLRLQNIGVKLVHGDIRHRSDLEGLGPVDWVIDAAANPSVLAGVDGKTSSRQLLEHNLYGTIEILEYCKNHTAGLILLSTSRVYSIEGLSNLKIESVNMAFSPIIDQNFPHGLSPYGVSELYETNTPVSIYGASKVASEILALEYAYSFDFPVWINRCGVLAGAGQFGRPDQGIFSFWINAFQKRIPMQYIGFEGNGYQVRDCLHPKDLVPLIFQQFETKPNDNSSICNLSGGIENSISLAQLTSWCQARCEPHKIGSIPTKRQFDIPWMVLDNRKAKELWDWKPKTSLEAILEEILAHSIDHPDWLNISNS